MTPKEARDTLCKQARLIPDKCIQEVVIDYILDFYLMVTDAPQNNR